MTKKLTQDYIKSLFEYKDGNLIWLVDRKKTKIGDKAGSLKGSGYIATGIDRKYYLNHRLIFLYHYGWLPKKIDHIDTNNLNNSIENLRPATDSQNAQNRKISSRNKSGYKNICWDKNAKKWSVRIRSQGNYRYFGLFDDIELADLVAQEARDKYNGNFARHR
jgi:hypothetical protein